MKGLTSMTIIFLFGTMFLSLFYMSSGVNMPNSHTSMNNCPFMAYGEVVCPMNLADHISAWKSTFTAITPALFLLLTITGTIALLVSTAPHLLIPKRNSIPILKTQLRERTYLFLHKPFQELFSNGILHSKVF